MKSPFAIFRKNQKILMVVITGMAMLSFIVFDPTSMRSGNAGRTFMYVLSGLLGGGIFWLLGRDSGKSSSYAAVGVLIGLVVAAFLPSSVNNDAPVKTAMGDLSREDILKRLNRRNIANNFLEAAYKRVAPVPDNPFMAQFWMQGLRQVQFGYNTDEPESDVILGFLLEQEAAEMGIQLSDDAVSKYILQATTINGKGLSKADFEKICSDMRVSETEVYNAIREELRCRLALILEIPREITTPELYWEDFRKLNVRQQLDVAAVPVGEFTAEVAEPSPAELENFFEQGKNAFFDDPARRSMVQAFGQPRRIRVAYLEADYEEVEKTIAAVTDAEIEKYYNDNKEMYRNRPLTNAGGGDPFLSQPKNAGEGGAGPLLPSLAPGDGSSPLGGAGSSEKSTPEKGGEKGAEGKDASPTSEQPQPAKPSEGKPEEKSSGDSGQAQRPTNIGGLLAQGQGISPFVDRELLLSALDEAGDSKEEKPVQSQPQGDAKKDPEPSAKANQDQKASPDASQNVGENAAKPPTEGSSENAKRRPVEALRPLPEFKPLDEALRDQIRDQLLRERTLAAQKKIIDTAREHLFSLAEKFTSKSLAIDVDMPQDKRLEEVQRIARETQATFSDDLKRYADEHKLKYVETKPLSAAEFGYEADYAIARAIEPNVDEFSQRTPMSAAQQLFNSPADQFFQPYIAADRAGKWFAYWKIDEIAAHVPKFEDEGIREQVLAVWKSNQARPKADERAKAIADLVSKNQSGMAEALSGQTITGKEGSSALVVIPTLPFSWLTVSTAPSTGLMSNNQPTISVIPGVDNPDSSFMKTVFDEMKVGDVKVVPNADSSVFYVVKVKNRIPSEPSDLEAQRQAFLREDLFGRTSLFGGGSAYDYLIAPDQRAVQRDWFRLLNDKYRVQRNTSADNSSGESPRSRGS